MDECVDPVSAGPRIPWDTVNPFCAHLLWMVYAFASNVQHLWLKWLKWLPQAAEATLPTQTAQSALGIDFPQASPRATLAND